MADAKAALNYACDWFIAHKPVPVEDRDRTFMMVTYALFGGDHEARLLALRLLEGQLYPEGSPPFGSLCERRGTTPIKPIPRKRGGDAFRNKVRDVIIAEAVQNVHDEFGFSYTRNRASRDKKNGTESACSIVAKALRRLRCNISEDAVEKIWRNPPTVEGEVKRMRIPEDWKEKVLKAIKNSRVGN